MEAMQLGCYCNHHCDDREQHQRRYNLMIPVLVNTMFAAMPLRLAAKVAMHVVMAAQAMVMVMVVVMLVVMVAVAALMTEGVVVAVADVAAATRSNQFERVGIAIAVAHLWNNINATAAVMLEIRFHCIAWVIALCFPTHGFEAWLFAISIGKTSAVSLLRPNSCAQLACNVAQGDCTLAIRNS